MKIVVGRQNELFGPWIAQQLDTQWFPGRGETVGLLDTEKGPVAGALYEGYNGASVIVHLAKLPGSILTHDFLWFGSYYPFVQLGVKKLISPVESTNLRSRKFIEHYGFTLEATLKDAAEDGDLLLYTMTKEDCRWLTLEGLKNGEAQSA